MFFLRKRETNQQSFIKPEPKIESQQYEDAIESIRKTVGDLLKDHSRWNVGIRNPGHKHLVIRDLKNNIKLFLSHPGCNPKLNSDGSVERTKYSWKIYVLAKHISQLDNAFEPEVNALVDAYFKCKENFEKSKIIDIAQRLKDGI